MFTFFELLDTFTICIRGSLVVEEDEVTAVDAVVVVVVVVNVVVTFSLLSEVRDFKCTLW